MSKTVEYRIGPIVGRGQTKTEARRYAETQAAEALTGTYLPVVVIAENGACAVGWRTPDGWCGQIDTGPAGRIVAGGGLGLYPDGTTREDMRRNLAAWLADILAPSNAPADHPPPTWLPESEHSEYHYKRTFQARYRAAKAEGQDDDHAHRIACGLA